uniref:Vascular endothelial growth factor receptor 3 n=1 Tax=Callorhinchus milii TaxID=7868 RepID=A0A4W3HCX7_CALMI
MIRRYIKCKDYYCCCCGPSAVTVLCSVTGLVWGYSMSSPTLNITEDEYIINVDSALSIICRSVGQRPLQWSWPGKAGGSREGSQAHNQADKTSVQSWTEESGGRTVSVQECEGSVAQQYCKIFTLTGARASDTGYYRCSYQFISAIVDGTTASSIYVFVQDFQQVFFSSSPETINFIYISKHSMVTVPCPVSVPNLNVSLRLRRVKSLLISVIWDNRRGMLVHSHMFDDVIYVKCETTFEKQLFITGTFYVLMIGSDIYEFSLRPDHMELIAGESLELTCSVRAEFNAGVDFQWDYPGKQVTQCQCWCCMAGFNPSFPLMPSSAHSLTLHNVTLSDMGQYVCQALTVSMSGGDSVVCVSVPVTPCVTERPFISLDSQLPREMEVTVGDRNVKLPVRLAAYPPPEVQWYKDGKFIKKSPTFNKIKLSVSGLVIREVAEQDSGLYTIVVRNSQANLQERLTLRLIVNVPPRIHEKEVASPTNIYARGSRQTLTCTVSGVPAPLKLLWHWRPWGPCGLTTVGRRPRDRTPECGDWRNITTDTAVNEIESLETKTEIVEGRNKTVSKLVILAANLSVMYKCSAFNKAGQDDRVIYFYVTSIPEGFGIEIQPSEIPVEGETVHLRCNADNYTYEKPRWYRLLPSALEGELGDPLVLECENMHQYAMELPGETLADAQMKGVALVLSIASVTLDDEGDYVCEVQDRKSGHKHCHRKYISVRAQESPWLLTNLSDVTVNVSNSLQLQCDVTGRPLPHLTWSKDEKPLHTDSGIILSERNRTLTIQRVREEDSGLYRCSACNSRGCVTSAASVAVEGTDDRTNVEVVILVGTGVIAVFFWILLILIFCNVKRTHPADIKTGYLSIIMDPDAIPLDEQCEYLPYDSSKWEFPRDRLRLGKTLGHGAFGKVVEASAFGIDKSSSCKTVAVKMLKDGATGSEHKALMSELKILIHIGNHLNVVNLLGACTKAKGPLMVIVEFCKYGNLSNYLRNKREDFIPYRDRAPRMRSQVISMVEAVKGMDKRCQGSGGETSFSIRTAMEKILSNSQEMPEVDDLWHRPLTMEDLICYSFQVARGMEFLASRKCIHRDLAARNILLSENNVVKICDFGLARDIYKDPDYVRKGNARLPLKWMAPESIFDKVYTTQSDVWSYGVLLWEIFSLGGSPYPGVQINEDFCQRLKEGTRMRAPEYATMEIYRIMLGCWQGEPRDRPTFSDLVELLGDLLQANVQQVRAPSVDKESHLSCSPRNPIALCVLSRYYNCLLLHGYPAGGNPVVCPSRVKTFEEVPLEQKSAVLNVSKSVSISYPCPSVTPPLQ